MIALILAAVALAALVLLGLAAFAAHIARQIKREYR